MRIGTLSVWFAVASLVPRAVQAHSGCSLMFAEGMEGLAKGRQEKYRGYKAWSQFPGALKERSHASH